MRIVRIMDLIPSRNSFRFSFPRFSPRFGPVRSIAGTYPRNIRIVAAAPVPAPACSTCVHHAHHAQHPVAQQFPLLLSAVFSGFLPGAQHTGRVSAQHPSSPLAHHAPHMLSHEPGPKPTAYLYACTIPDARHRAKTRCEKK
jgi:hypothetical protein